MVERRIVYRVLGRKPQGRRPLVDSGVGGSSGSGMLGHGHGLYRLRTVGGSL